MFVCPAARQEFMLQANLQHFLLEDSNWNLRCAKKNKIKKTLRAWHKFLVETNLYFFIFAVRAIGQSVCLSLSQTLAFALFNNYRLEIVETNFIHIS